jgi:hypothetical protein
MSTRAPRDSGGGSTLADHYYLGEVIGKGRYGYVRLAGELNGEQALCVCKTLSKPKGATQVGLGNLGAAIL